MLRLSFELIIAFLDVNQVLLLILKYHRHVNNLKCFHWLSVSKLVFKVDRETEQQIKINEQVEFFTVGRGPTEEIQ